MKLISITLPIVALVAHTGILSAEEPFHGLTPLMVVPKECVLKDDFSKEGVVDEKSFIPQQGTQWKIANGVLHGTESTKEYQASKPDHNGLQARLELPTTPPQYMATFSVRFIGGTPDKNTPVLQFGHHVTHLRILPTGTDLLASRESLRVAEAPDFKLVDGEWYHVMVEVKGDEVVVQFAKGPVFYGKHESYADPVKSKNRKIGFAGAVGGVIELDDVSVWSINEEVKKEWPENRAKIPPFEPVDLKAAKQKKVPEKK
jgi:hypothetical protein